MTLKKLYANLLTQIGNPLKDYRMAKREANTFKKSSLTMRLPTELHDQLSEAAARNLVSVSAEAERRLRRTFQEDDAAGDKKVSALLRYLAAATDLVIQTNGHPERSPASRVQIIEMWEEAIDRFLPIALGESVQSKEVRNLINARKRYEAAFRSHREEFGLPALPAMSWSNSNRTTNNPEVSDDGILTDGAFAALNAEYDGLLVEPTREEIRWAQITDDIARVRQKTVETPKGKTGATAILVMSMLGDLTPNEKACVIEMVNQGA